MDGQPAWSMAEARNWAAPAGVRSTTRFALASAETSSSGPTRASAPEAPSSARPVNQPPGQPPRGPDDAGGPSAGGSSAGGPGRPPGREPGPPGSPGSAYTSVPPAPRRLTAPSSSRARERGAL